MTDPSPPTSAQSLVVATAGHVDHGKSSLVKALTGHDTDTLQEEIARGLTINLGYAYTRCEPPDSEPVWLGFVDVPGHRDFINNMLAGVSAVEGALLVVAVDDGIMPQTREHLDILDLLGIEKAVVALTKIDRGSDERSAEVSGAIRELLATTALADAPIVPVSSLDGRGIDNVRAALLALRSGPAHANVAQQQRFRFLVDRSFSVKGVGTVVTGTAVAGTVAVGDSVRHSGSGEVCRIRGIRLHDQALTTIGAGQRAALNVTLTPGSVGRGDWLGDPARQQGVSRFDGSLRLLAAGTALKSGVHYHLYIGASHRLAHLRVLAADADNDSLLRVSCDSPLFVHHGDRFIIRDPADRHTIAGGEVLDCLVPARRGSSPEHIRFLQAQTSPAVTCLQSLLRIPPGVVDMDAFARNRNLTSAAVAALLDELAQ
ncbi:MAG: selenocysteine-specific translation elongation factor, partial [Pseudohongiellaceae bacterium]